MKERTLEERVEKLEQKMIEVLDALAMINDMLFRVKDDGEKGA